MANFSSAAKADLDDLRLLSAFSTQVPDLVYSGPNGFTIRSTPVPNYTAVFTGSGFSSPNPLTNQGNIETLTLYKSSGPNGGSLTEVFTVTDLDLSPTEASRFAADTIFRGNDIIKGSTLNDRLDGYAGNDVLDGGRGDDRINGGTGKDKIQGGAGKDQVEGGDKDDTLSGGAQNDKLEGGTGNDLVRGDAGRDWVEGGFGKDKLMGGASIDMFVFDTKLGSGNVDTIGDYGSGDKIMLAKSVFSLFGKGNLKDAFEQTSTGPHHAKHDQAHHRDSKDDHDGPRLIYNKDNGFLSYDADGSGGKAAMHFATLTDDSGHHPTSLSYSDFIIG